VQRCKSAGGRCKGGKVEAGKTPDYGVQSTEYGFGRHEVGAWLRRALLEGECKAEPCPYPRALLAKRQEAG
jgi:hypothetical protein